MPTVFKMLLNSDSTWHSPRNYRLEQKIKLTIINQGVFVKKYVIALAVLIGVQAQATQLKTGELTAVGQTLKLSNCGGEARLQANGNSVELVITGSQCSNLMFKSTYGLNVSEKLNGFGNSGRNIVKGIDAKSGQEVRAIIGGNKFASSDGDKGEGDLVIITVPKLISDTCNLQVQFYSGGTNLSLGALARGAFFDVASQYAKGVGRCAFANDSSEQYSYRIYQSNGTRFGKEVEEMDIKTADALQRSLNCIRITCDR